MFVVLIHSMLPKDNNLKNLRYFNMINNSILHQIYMLPYQDLLKQKKKERKLNNNYIQTIWSDYDSLVDYWDF